MLMIASAMAWLVVSREKDQSMMIGHDLRVTVLRVRGERALVVTSRRRATARQPNWAESDPKWLEVGQTVDVDHDIRFQVMDIRAEKVRLGFSLPPTLQLRRQEVYDAIKRENRRALDFMLTPPSRIRVDCSRKGKVMAYFEYGQTPSEEPFTRYLSPLQVAQSIQGAIDAVWHNLPAAGRSSDALTQSVFNEFSRVETWWMSLSKDLKAHEILAASQAAFKMPQALEDAATQGELTHEQMFQWMPAKEIAEAFFWSWLLQPVGKREPGRTALLVRAIIERQLRNAEEDLSRFL